MRPRRVWIVLTALILLPTAAEATWFEENFEVHGFLTSKLYVRSRSLDVSDNAKVSSWRTELNLEPSMHLFSNDDVSISFYGVFRPTYDAVYDVEGDTWGSDLKGGHFGAGAVFPPRTSILPPPQGLTDPGKVINGDKYFGCRGGIGKETCYGNADAGSVFLGKLAPASIIDDTVFFGAVTAPIVPRGGHQPNVGGNSTLLVYDSLATGNVYLKNYLFGPNAPPGILEASGILEPLRNSLAMAGTTPGSVGTAVYNAKQRGTPLNYNTGSIGDRKSLKGQAVADINRTQSNLQWDCTDNAHYWCFAREAYLEIEYGDTLARIGKQQVVWGKTDAFRLQDNIMPIDLGYHNVFPTLEERRIPQLSLDVIHSLGDIGPLQDVSLEFVWLFDRFRPLQFGQCGEPYAFTVACELRTDASAHSLFNIALARVEEVDWTFQNTEPGLRAEFRIPKPSISFSLSAFYSHQDLPLVKFVNPYSVDNPNAAWMLFLQTSQASLIDSLGFAAGEGHPWIDGFDPLARDANGTPIGSLAVANNQLQRAWRSAFNTSVALNPDCAGTSGETLGACMDTFQPIGAAWGMSEAVLTYPRVLTLGASADYQVPGSDTIIRLEMSYDFDRGITDTSKLDAKNSSDVFSASIGLDRPTYIPFLNATRTAFLSFQTFVEHVNDYSDHGYGNGMIVQETQVLSTLFMQNYWRSDSIVLTTFLAYDWNAQSWISGPSVKWSINSNLFVEAGVNVIFGKNDHRHNILDLCPNGSLTSDAYDPVANNCTAADPRGWQPGTWQILNYQARRTARAPWFNGQSFADQFMEDRDEVWVGITYQF